MPILVSLLQYTGVIFSTGQSGHKTDRGLRSRVAVGERGRAGNPRGCLWRVPPVSVKPPIAEIGVDGVVEYDLAECPGYVYRLQGARAAGPPASQLVPPSTAPAPMGSYRHPLDRGKLTRP